MFVPYTKTLNDVQKSIKVVVPKIWDDTNENQK